MTAEETVLLIGIGNPGRQDDGLGPACAAAIESEEIPGVRIEANYQLAVEDASDAAAAGIVIFADACVDGPEPFAFEEISPVFRRSFTSHLLDPETLLAAVLTLFGSRPRAFVMRIRGYSFNEFGEALSPAARENLGKAVAFLIDFIPKAIREQESEIHSAADTVEKQETICRTENM